mmetsp:Transcript_52049/g.123938  ORF Transcript_52049/g.123938 Transcript_52049/m.123938 type:complete len:159 (-) Transcript_52049:319-795(-)
MGTSGFRGATPALTAAASAAVEALAASSANSLAPTSFSYSLQDAARRCGATVLELRGDGLRRGFKGWLLELRVLSALSWYGRGVLGLLGPRAEGRKPTGKGGSNRGDFKAATLRGVSLGLDTPSEVEGTVAVLRCGGAEEELRHAAALLSESATAAAC